MFGPCGAKSRTGRCSAGRGEPTGYLGLVRGWILKCINLPHKLKKKIVFFLLESFLKKYQLESPNRLTHPELLFSFLWGSQDCGSLLYWTQSRKAGTACQDLELRVSHVHLLSGEGCLLYRFFQTKDVSTIVSIQISEIPEKEHRILFLIFKNCLSQNVKTPTGEPLKNS